ncbi:MAG: hypothetical protein V2B19_24110 [Pseudomonadota bacterium]
MTKLQDARFRKTTFSSSSNKTFDFDADMLEVLMAIEESKTVLQIVRQTKMDPAVFKKTLMKLFKLKLIEEVKEDIIYATDSFVAHLKEVLVNLVGPLGEMLADETAEKMNFKASRIPQAKVADFIYEVAKEIPGGKQRAEFKRLMIQEIKNMK